MSGEAHGRARRNVLDDPLDPGGWIRPGDRPRHLAEQRAAAFVVLALVAALVEQLGPHRHMAAALFAFVFAPLNVAIERRAPAPLRDRLHIVHDLTAIVVAIAIVPVGWAAGLAVGTMIVVGAASTVGAREFAGLAVAFLSSMACIAAIHGVGGTWLPLIATAAAIGPIGTYGRWYRHQLRLAAGRTDLLIESSSAMFFEADQATGRMLALRGNAEGILGRSLDDLMRRPLLAYIDPTDHAELLRVVLADEVSTTVRYLHPDGSPRWLRLMGRQTPTTHGAVVAGVAIDVTELERSKQELRQRAEHDTLTGLNNRDVFIERLHQALDGDPEHVAVAIIDLDDFKWINDTMGHPAGDAVLRHIGDQMTTLVQEGLTICRLGGDEFGFLVRDSNPRRRAVQVAHGITMLLADGHLVERIEVKLKASIGIAIGWQGATSRDLLRDADIAMYEAKRNRRGVRVFSARPESLTSEQLSTVARLNRHLEDEIRLWFQPIVDLATSRIVAVEGLARWDHPELGLLQPASFLAAIQRGELSERLDRLALAASARFAADAAEQGTPVQVAFNMSALGLGSPSLLPHLRRMAAEGHRLDLLTVEVSERDIQEEIADLVSTLTQLRELGLGLAVDDYGTGFSSLIRLRNVPFTQVKIDRSFVTAITRDRTDRAIVRSTVDLARELSLLTVAEGVEDAATADVLRELGCERAQGFGFGRPRPAHDILARLHAELPAPAFSAETHRSPVA